MATSAEELDVDGVKVRLTSPDKVYFPKLGKDGTKRKLVEYYMAVASGPMLTALRDRPTHLQRFPDGIDGEEIYQKRVPQKHPDYLETCVVTFPSGRTADALKVTHPSAIVWAAQMGTITLHPWQVRCADTEHPDELRIDLDPQPGTGFKEASAIAVDVLKPLLDELGMVGFPKTSGGRGVHVFLRIKPDWDFIAVRRAGIAIAREVERRAPDAVTTSWWKEERGKRLFIDYNQNARDRTFASAYSVRKTPIATVSMPLTWDELRDADPDDYTIGIVPALLEKRGDAMADLDAVAQSIEPLLEMVKADEERGLGDLPYPPSYPKMPGEPPRVQPSKKVSGELGRRRKQGLRQASPAPRPNRGSSSGSGTGQGLDRALCPPRSRGRPAVRW
jgi:DNA ligase D